MSARNCRNHKNLPDDILAVTQYTYGVEYDLRNTGAQKIISLGDVRFYECPLSYITSETWELIRLVYMIDDTKQMLFDGGLSQQPFWLIEAIEIHKAEAAQNASKGKHGEPQS